MSTQKTVYSSHWILRINLWRQFRYIGLGLIFNSLIWGLAITSLKKAKPVYTSDWALIVPGSGAGVNFNIPDIGQASSSSVSAFGSSSSDPRANYNYIITSEPLLNAAAASLKLPPDKFGKPHIKLIDNTTVIQLEVTGSSAKEAQQKSWAIYNALNNRLNKLRTEVAASRDEGTKSALLASQTKLKEAQNRLSQYKARSALTSVEQIKDLLTNIEQLRKQRSETLAQQKSISNRLQQLSTNLRLSPQQAADALALQSDQVFQQYLKDYSESSGALEILLSKWGMNHPQVISEQAKWMGIQDAIITRARYILKRNIDKESIEQLYLTTGSGRVSLFESLVGLNAEMEGVAAEAQALDEQIKLLEKRQNILSQKEVTLDSLERNVKIAEAVFSSTLAKVDLSKTDIFVDYPLLQMLVEPTLPDKPSSPRPPFVYAGALFGSICTTSALVILWWRKKLKERVSQMISKTKPEPE
ncbi:hypothetical protein H6G33_07200 [Calothrix sp. FACHB-1219]|uniref:GumC family protein n=1 Tax=unclassified Calothrix TaxID=2619626 RepID=UPI001682E65E|nr:MULTISPECIES: hypothetical protein [unclassified Calothrix]MBD2204673.1 hypothetical protein [Calothrix sp. FACHB-168]MBD2216815.1 hypothetical protein [Calothrix sp. FACHB-1219]